MNIPIVSTEQEREADYLEDVKKLLETINQAVSMINTLSKSDMF